MVTERALRIVYFGTPGFAVPSLDALIQSRHQVVALVSQPDRPRGRGHHVAPTATKELAVRAGVPVLQPTKLREDSFLREIAALRPDLGVVAAYGRILPEALLAVPGFGMINVHASLLPKYRGAAPVHRAVIAGEEVTGVTIMRLVAELDAGPMLASIRHPIAPEDTSVDVERALAERGAGLLLDVVDRLAQGPVAAVSQDHTQATYAPKLVKSESPVDWSLPARAIHYRVRGLQPWPMASAAVDRLRVLLHRTAVFDARTDARPGTIVDARGDLLAVAAGEGTILRILDIQPEGRRAMHVREFLSGRKLEAGTVFGSG
jgi:methionyl-tRNA formyltransferase